jgi:purine-binding chemotaxis protein CheW
MSRGNLQRIQTRKKIEAARKYLSFRLGDRTYGINMLYVREIAGRQDILPISKVPPYVRGVINKFDEVIPVIDLKERLDLPQKPPSSRSCIVIVEIIQRLKMVCGLLVDAVEEVNTIPVGAIVQGTDADDVCVLGVAELEAGPQIELLNIYRLLDPEEIPVIETTRALRVV